MEIIRERSKRPRLARLCQFQSEIYSRKTGSYRLKADFRIFNI